VKEISEIQLLEQIKQGDKQAFDVLADKYRGRIERAVSRYVHERAAINDVTQETLMRAFVGIPKFNGDSQFYTWVYRIAINTAKNYAKKNNKNGVEIDIDSNIGKYFVAKKSLHTDENDPENINENSEFEAAIKKAIDALPDNLRDFFHVIPTISSTI